MWASGTGSGYEKDRNSFLMARSHAVVSNTQWAVKRTTTWCSGGGFLSRPCLWLWDIGGHDPVCRRQRQPAVSCVLVWRFSARAHRRRRDPTLLGDCRDRARFDSSPIDLDAGSSSRPWRHWLILGTAGSGQRCYDAEEEISFAPNHFPDAVRSLARFRAHTINYGDRGWNVDFTGVTFSSKIASMMVTYTDQTDIGRVAFINWLAQANYTFVQHLQWNTIKKNRCIICQPLNTFTFTLPGMGACYAKNTLLSVKQPCTWIN